LISPKNALTCTMMPFLFFIQRFIQ
jgi:hypothetical protein